MSAPWLEQTLCRCGQPLGRGQRTQCYGCARRDRNRNGARERRLPTIIVSVDCEGVMVDGVMRLISASFGREDGSSASLSGRYLTAEKVLCWLLDQLSQHYIAPDGAEHKQAAVSFHFNWDTAMLAREFPEDRAYLVHKATARSDSLLCWTKHHPSEDPSEDPCAKIHRTDRAAIKLVIGEGGENDLLAFDPVSLLALATTPKRRFYIEHRPHGDRFDGNRRLDIHDTGTAFSGSLETVIGNWNPDLSSAQRSAIAWGKQARKDGTFATAPIAEIEAYSESECVAHAQVVRLLLDTIRDAAHIVIKPTELFGSGSIASGAFKHHKVPKRDLKRTDGDRVVSGIKIDDIPQLTYFGGLIEACVIGALDEPVDTVDQNSAYPARMVELPCMKNGHGKWMRRHGRWQDLPPRGAIGNVLASWMVKTPSTPPFMVRTLDGRVHQPLVGLKVWVTLDEFHAALDHFGEFAVWSLDAVWWVPECECEPPFAWIREIYEARLIIKRQMKDVERLSAEWWRLHCQQNALKLIINSCYGKLAQRQHGGGPYSNLHYASTITGATRAKVRIETWLREAQGGTVVYQHTDSVSSIGGTPTDGGPALGAWGMEEQSTEFVIAQPGLAISLGKGKMATRGVDKGEFTDSMTKFVATEDLTKPPGLWAVIKVPGRQMISHRMAAARNKPETAGLFVDALMKIQCVTKKRACYKAVQVPGNPRAWALPPIDLVDNPATLESVRQFRSAIDILFSMGKYDDEAVHGEEA